MQTTAATVSAVSMAGVSRLADQRQKIRQVSSSVAMVMPEIGFDDEPISPVSRDETVTNRKPNSRIISAPRKPSKLKPSPSCGTRHQREHHAEAAEQHDGHRQVALGAARPRPCRRRWPRRSRRPATIELKISGKARHMLMMPPAATAPAPM